MVIWKGESFLNTGTMISSLCYGFCLEIPRLLFHQELKFNSCPFSLQSPLTTQLAITCSNLTIETLEQGVKYVQS